MRMTFHTCEPHHTRQWAAALFISRTDLRFDLAGHLGSLSRKQSIRAMQDVRTTPTSRCAVADPTYRTTVGLAGLVIRRSHPIAVVSMVATLLGWTGGVAAVASDCPC